MRWLSKRRRAQDPVAGVRAAAVAGLGPALFDRHMAIVDPLLIRPLPAETLFSGQRLIRGRGRV